jgi:hypothetical protein
LDKAIKTFAPGVAVGDVLFFFDNSSFGDGRSGILLTDATLYSSDGFTKVKIDFAGLMPAAIRKFYGDNRLFVGEQSLNGPGLFGRKEFPVLSEMLNEISRSVNPGAGQQAPEAGTVVDPDGRHAAGSEAAPSTLSPAAAGNLPTAGEVLTGRVVAFILLVFQGILIYLLATMLSALVFKDKFDSSSSIMARILLSLIVLAELPKLSARITQALVNVRNKSGKHGSAE